MSDAIRKKVQDLALGINDEVISLPVDLCNAAAAATQFSLICKPLNPRKQNLRAMSTTLPRLWGVAVEVTGWILPNQKLQFLFHSEESMLSVLRRGPWSFNDWMCALQRWHPHHSDDELKFISFWVQIRGILLQFLTLPMVTAIGNGEFLDTDFQAEGAIHVDYVRVRLLWNADEPLRFQRQFQFGGQTRILKFCYEKLRSFCTVCGLLTHDGNDYPTISGPEDMDGPNDDDNDEADDADHPPGFAPPSPRQTPFDGPSSEHSSPPSPASNKRRKTESPGISDTPICSEKRQVLVTEDTQEQFLKRRKIQADIHESRDWFSYINQEGE